MSIIVKVVQIPGGIKEVGLEDGAKVSDALRLANIDATGKAIKVSNVDATAATVLFDGATVVVSGKITGNL